MNLHIHVYIYIIFPPTHKITSVFKDNQLSFSKRLLRYLDSFRIG